MVRKVSGRLLKVTYRPHVALLLLLRSVQQDLATITNAGFWTALKECNSVLPVRLSWGNMCCRKHVLQETDCNLQRVSLAPKRLIIIWLLKYEQIGRKLSVDEKRNAYKVLCFVYRASLYNIFQTKPTMCTLLLSIFISTSVHVSGNYVPIIRRNYFIYATLVFFTLYGWLSGLLTKQLPIQREKYKCRIDTISSPDDRHIVARNMYRSWNECTKKKCAPSWTSFEKEYQILVGLARKQRTEENNSEKCLKWTVLKMWNAFSWLIKGIIGRLFWTF